MTYNFNKFSMTFQESFFPGFSMSVGTLSLKLTFLQCGAHSFHFMSHSDPLLSYQDAVLAHLDSPPHLTML